MVEKLMKLNSKNFNLLDNNVVTIKEQTLFKANGEEGLHLWEASIVLSRWLILNRKMLENKSALELGSGCGLLGISIIKHTNVGTLIMSDYVDSVLDNLKINVETNSETHSHNKSKFAVKEINDKQLNYCPMCFNKRLEILKLNWMDFYKFENIKEEEKYDIIIGTELIYQGGPLNELAHLIKYLLKKDGICYISMPLKRSMTGTFQLNLEKINMQMIAEKLDDEQLYSNNISDKKEDVKLFEDLKKIDVTLYKISHKIFDN